MAAMAIVQLRYLDEDNAYRRKLAAIYDSLLIENNNLSIVKAPYADECSYHLYEIVAEKRDELIDVLCKNDIFPGVHYRDNSEYTLYSSQKGKCPNAAYKSDRLVTLPLHLWLEEDDVRRIASIVNGFAGTKA